MIVDGVAGAAGPIPRPIVDAVPVDDPLPPLASLEEGDDWLNSM